MPASLQMSRKLLDLIQKSQEQEKQKEQQSSTKNENTNNNNNNSQEEKQSIFTPLLNQLHQVQIPTTTVVELVVAETTGNIVWLM